MTTRGDEEQLAINVIAKLTDLEKQMAKANGITAKAFREMTLTTRRATRQMEDDAARSAERINAAMATVGTRIGAVGRTFATAAAAAFSTEKLIAASQAYVRASNALKVAGLSGAALTDTFTKLYDIAQANGAPIETLVGLYSKAAQVQTALGASSGQLIQFTTAVAQALRVSGTSAEEAQGALLQMGQALGSGTVHAEEYNSMLEGAYPILQAAAAGIKEAGGEVSKLTALVKDGEVSSKAFFYGVLAGAPLLNEKLAGSTETLSQAWTKFENALTKAVGELDKATGATAGLTSGLESLIPWLEKLPAAIDWASEKWRGFKGAVNEAAAAFNAFMGYDSAEAMKAAGLVPIEEARAEAAKAAMFPAGGKGNREGVSKTSTDATRRVSDAFSLFDKPKAKIKPVSLADYPADAESEDGKKKADAYQAAIEKTRESIDATNTEIAVIGLDAQMQARMRKEQELVNAAKKEGKDLTPQLVAEIEKEAAAYGEAQGRLEKAKTAHQELIDIQRFAGQTMAGFFSDIVSGGRNAQDALMNMTKKLADAALQAAILGDGPLASLFGTKVAGGGVGGLIGSIFRMFSADGSAFLPGGARAFADGGAFTNHIVDTPTAFRFANGTGLMGEAGPEAIMPLSRDKSGRLGVQAAIGAPAKSEPSSHTMNLSIDLKGANGDAAIQAAVMRGVQAGISQFSRYELPGRLADIHARGQ